MIQFSSRSIGHAVACTLFPWICSLAAGCDQAGSLPGLGDPLVTVEADENRFVLADLSGDFYFVLRNNDGKMLFTKRGEMLIGPTGKITTPDGFFVQGYAIDEKFRIQTNALADMSIPLGILQVKEATTRVAFQGNLSTNDMNVGESIITTFQVFDGQGNTIKTRLTAMLSSFSDSLAVWDVAFTREQDGSLLGSEIYIYDADGDLEIDPQLTISVGTDDGSPPINIDFRSVRGDRDRASEIAVSSQDGAPIGTLNDYNIESLGIIAGSFSNDLGRDLGRLVVALIRNPETLIPESASVFSAGPDTAEPFITTPSSL